MSDMVDDFRAMREMTKEMRDERLERFYLNVMPKLQDKYSGEIHDKGTRIVVYGTKHGTITIYPKMNNLLVHKTNKWHKPAVKWLYKNGII